jgi:hypothetical protein
MALAGCKVSAAMATGADPISDPANSPVTSINDMLTASKIFFM